MCVCGLVGWSKFYFISFLLLLLFIRSLPSLSLSLDSGLSFQSLQRANSLQLASVALAGYSSAQDIVWKNMCKTLLGQLYHPYLRCCFSSLGGRGEEGGFLILFIFLFLNNLSLSLPL